MTETLNLEKLDLRKEQVLNLKKQIGLEGQMAQVALALDYSGSMGPMYRDGRVQELVERLMPIAMAFDSNQEIDFYLFSNKCWKVGGITLNNLAGYVDKVRSKYEMSGTSYAPIIRAIVNDYAKTGGFLGFGKKPAMMELPVYVIFVTDGNCDDRSEAEAAIRDAANHGIFFQFVGIGYEAFAFLDKLDNLSGRVLDNANFFKVQNVGMETDANLYSKLLTEFPGWIPQAKQKGMIR